MRGRKKWEREKRGGEAGGGLRLQGFLGPNSTEMTIHVLSCAPWLKLIFFQWAFPWVFLVFLQFFRWYIVRTYASRFRSCWIIMAINFNEVLAVYIAFFSLWPTKIGLPLTLAPVIYSYFLFPNKIPHEFKVVIFLGEYRKGHNKAYRPSCHEF